MNNKIFEEYVIKYKKEKKAFFKKLSYTEEEAEKINYFLNNPEYIIADSYLKNELDFFNLSEEEADKAFHKTMRKLIKQNEPKMMAVILSAMNPTNADDVRCDLLKFAINDDFCDEEHKYKIAEAKEHWIDKENVFSNQSWFKWKSYFTEYKKSTGGKGK